MTSGTTITDTRVSQGYVEYNYPLNQNTPGLATVGKLRTKTWSGTNSSTPYWPQEGKKVYYTYLHQGVTITKAFRMMRPRRAKYRYPNGYSMSFDYLDKTSCGPIFLLQNGANYKVYYNPGVSTALIVGEGLNLPQAPTFGANDQIVLINKLVNAFSGGDFNMSVFLGEGHQTLKMIGDSATKLAKAYSQARKGNLAGAALTLYSGTSKTRPRKATANNWLELQYGWLPLLEDMKSGAEMLSHQLHVPFRKRYKVRRKLAVPIATINNFNLAYSFADAEVFTSRDLVAYIHEQPDIPTIAGLRDPELVAWELVPFSFVADWVAPIGDYLRARAAASRLEGLFITSTFKVRHSENPVWRTTAGGFKYSGGYGYMRGNVQLDRTVSTSVGVPLPEVKPLDKVASWRHCANALALLTQVVLSPPSRFTRPPGLSHSKQLPS